MTKSCIVVNSQHVVCSSRSTRGMPFTHLPLADRRLSQLSTLQAAQVSIQGCQLTIHKCYLLYPNVIQVNEESFGHIFAPNFHF